MLIQEYQKMWVDYFTELRKTLTEALVNLPVSIEHKGNTSVPGLAAKPVIDSDIVFSKRADFDEIKMRLEKIGYCHNGNQGISGREVFKRDQPAFKQAVLDFTSHHLYVCPASGEELPKNKLFRDYLLANEEARIQYQELKYAMAEEANQVRKKYAQLKERRATRFITGILEKSRSGSTTNTPPVVIHSANAIILL